MLIITIFLGSILFLTVIKYYGKRRNKCDFPMCPGALPIIGNAHILLGDEVHVFNTMKKLTVKLLENGGYLALLLGPFKHLYILGDPDDVATALNACLNKDYIFSFMRPWIGEGLISANAPTWKKNRKLLHPMFGLQHVRRYLPVFNLQARRLVERFTEHENKGAFNPELLVLLGSFETICQTTFGADLKVEDLTKSKKYLESIDSMLALIVTRVQKLWLHSDFIFNWTGMRRKQDELLRVINNISNHLTQKRKSKLNSSTIKMDELENFRPFVDRVLEVAAENEGFTDEKILQELNTLITAGYDTTANSIIYCLMVLGHHQDVQDKLSRELKEVFSDSDRDVDKDDIPKLVYLEAVLKESLRLYPVGPVLPRRTDVDLKLKKHTIPAGSDFFVFPYAVNRHPMWGPDAEQFRPERWLDGTAPTNPNLFATFGLGRRGCIGKTFSMLSMKTTISHVVRRFRITADITKLVLKEDVLLKPASGQYIILEPRID